MSSLDMTGWKSRFEGGRRLQRRGPSTRPEDSEKIENRTHKQGSGHYNIIAHNIDYATQGIKRATKSAACGARL